MTINITRPPEFSALGANFRIGDPERFEWFAAQHPELVRIAVEAGKRLESEIPDAWLGIHVNADEDGLVVTGFVPHDIQALIAREDELDRNWALALYEETGGKVLVGLRSRRRDVESS